ncbi:MAG: OmpH family outer membrane protein [Bacteroidales bacterium]|nr:OmpH family outer membrane protein [Bacteroidales bacterium]
MEKKLQILTVLNVLLFIGLAGIYALHFFGPKSNNVETVKVQPQTVELIEDVKPENYDGANPRMAYINTDTLMQRLNIVRTFDRKLKYDLQKLQEDLVKKQRALDKKVTAFQKEVNAAAISRNVAQIRENELMKEQQELMKLSEQYNNRLGVQEGIMNGQLIDTIQSFLMQYSQQNNIDLIFNNVKGNDFFYAKESYDITKDVLRKMNKQYK